MMEIAAIVDAMKTGPKNGRMGVDQRSAGLVAVVARLYSLKGMGGDEKKITPEIILAVKELEKEVALKYPFFTLAEVRFALETGVKGGWDDQPTYLNVANYCRWLKAYRDSAARLEASQAIENCVRMAAPSQQIEAGTIETRNAEAAKRLLNECLEEVRNFGRISAGHLDGALASLYDYLRSSGQMERPEPAAIQAAMHRAAEMKARGVQHQKSIGQIIQEGAKSVTATAKRFLLEEYLKTL